MDKIELTYNQLLRFAKMVEVHTEVRLANKFKKEGSDAILNFLLFMYDVGQGMDERHIPLKTHLELTDELWNSKKKPPEAV